MLLGGCAEDLFSEGADHPNWLPSFDSDSTFSVITWNIENFAN